MTKIVIMTSLPRSISDPKLSTLFQKTIESSRMSEVFFYNTFDSPLIPVSKYSLCEDKNNETFCILELPQLQQIELPSEEQIEALISFLWALEEYNVIYGDLKFDHLRKDVNGATYLIDYNMYTLSNLATSFRTQSYACRPLTNGDPYRIIEPRFSLCWALGIMIYRALVQEKSKLNVQEYSRICATRQIWEQNVEKINSPWQNFIKACTDMENPPSSLASIIHLTPSSLKKAPIKVTTGATRDWDDNWVPEYDVLIVPFLLESNFDASTIILALECWWRYASFFNYSYIGALVVIFFASLFTGQSGQSKHEFIRELINLLPRSNFLSEKAFQKILSKYQNFEEVFFFYLDFSIPAFFFQLQIDSSSMSLYLVSNPLNFRKNRRRIEKGQKVEVSEYIYSHLSNYEGNEWMEVRKDKIFSNVRKIEHRRSKSLD